MADSEKQVKILHSLNSSGDSESFTLGRFFLLLIGVAVIAILAGYLTSLIRPKQTGTTSRSSTAKVQKTAGIADKSTFKDKAEGTLKEGGVDGEGNFHLERPGGESQNVYLTSSTVDLSQYLNKKVRVWGETFQAQKAGWLMDVGLVEVLQ